MGDLEKQLGNLRGYTSRLQKPMVDLLITTYPQLRTTRWRNAVEEAFREVAADVGIDEDFRPMLDGVPYIPDAYFCDVENNELHFFEVEISHLLSGEKLRAYGKFAIDLAAFGVNLALFTVNKHGHINAVDLVPAYGEYLLLASQDKKCPPS
jgi:hypothetical protein